VSGIDKHTSLIHYSGKKRYSAGSKIYGHKGVSQFARRERDMFNVLNIAITFFRESLQLGRIG
jgi:hypothetical protein